jgi:transcriptional regulator with XRE-family HTH domain
VPNTVTKLRRIRREHGFSNCRPLAEALGMSDMAVHYWEAGKGSPRPVNARRLEAVLQTSIDVLLSPENEKEPDAETPGSSRERQTQKAGNGDSLVSKE